MIGAGARDCARRALAWARVAGRWCRLVGYLLVQRPWPGLRRYARRLGVGFTLLLILAPLQTLHALCLALDELLFPAYRRVSLREPVLAFGTPRSGTTFLHRLLACCADTTTFATWECLFAPSILERRSLRLLARIDGRFGAPVARLVAALGRSVGSAMDGLHPTALDAPEEDYFALAPSLDCFLLAVAFPEAPWLWRLAQLDERPAQERAAFASRYLRCLQRHLYAHGPHLRLVSKNAAFAGAALTLAEGFPDARLIVCRRDPLDALDSQVRVLAGVRRALGTDGAACGFDARLVDAFAFWDTNLRDVPHALAVPLERLSHRTAEVLSEARRHASLDDSAELVAALKACEAPNLPHRPATPRRAPGAPSADPRIARRFAPASEPCR